MEEEGDQRERENERGIRKMRQLNLQCSSLSLPTFHHFHSLFFSTSISPSFSTSLSLSSLSPLSLCLYPSLLSVLSLSPSLTAICSLSTLFSSVSRSLFSLYSQSCLSLLSLPPSLSLSQI